jgi:hypothetical protein
VALLLGKVYDAREIVSNQNNGCSIKNIGLADYPLLLVERASVNTK